MAGVCVNLRTGEFAELDSIGTVDLFANDVDLLFDREIEVVQELEVRRGLATRDHCSSELAGSGSTFCPVITNDRDIGTTSDGQFLYEGEFGGGVRTGKEV